MGLKVPAAESLESPKEENEVLWHKSSDETGFIYSGKNAFKSGEGEFTVVGQGDSFANSRAHVLLTDVPGASANSGAAITAENSGGKAAFVSAETSSAGQEVAVGAGSEIKTLLEEEGKSHFLQLAALNPADRALAAGRVSSAGAVVSGEGFSASKKAQGTYTVTFSAETEIEPAVTVTPITTTAIPLWTVGAISKTSVEVRIWNFGTGIAMDCAFSFVAYG